MARGNPPAKTAARSRRKPGPVAASPAIDATESNVAPAASIRPGGALREQMIAEAAYYRALNRNFNDGDPADDWYAAEREVNEQLNGCC